jgi:hypothetical protein
MILIYVERERERQREIVTTLVKYTTSENETSEGNKKKDRRYVWMLFYKVLGHTQDIE